MVRVKQRYFLCEIILPDFLNPSPEKMTINEGVIAATVKSAVYRMFGDYGLGLVLSGFGIHMFNPYTRIFMLRVKFRDYNLVAASLPTIMKIHNVICSVRVLHLSGTIRSSLKFLQRFDHKQILLLEERCKNPKLRAEFRRTTSAITARVAQTTY